MQDHQVVWFAHYELVRINAREENFELMTKMSGCKPDEWIKGP